MKRVTAGRLFTGFGALVVLGTLADWIVWAVTEAGAALRLGQVGLLAVPFVAIPVIAYGLHMAATTTSIRWEYR